MAAVTMAMTASGTAPADTAASTTCSLAHSPVVKGAPAWASRRMAKQRARRGWRWARPR